MKEDTSSEKTMILDGIKYVERQESHRGACSGCAFVGLPTCDTSVIPAKKSFGGDCSWHGVIYKVKP